MEGSQYLSDGLATSTSAAYPSPSTHSHASTQPEQHTYPQTLPPIIDQSKPSHNTWKIMYGGHPQGQPSQAPGGQAPNPNLSSYQQTSQPPPRGPAYAMSAPPSYPS